MLEESVHTAINQIAVSLEPVYSNWRYESHAWCLETSIEVEEYLESIGIKTRISRPFQDQQLNSFSDLEYFHAWVELSDGTIVDPTIKQFFLANHSHCLDPECYLCRPCLEKDDYFEHDIWVVSPDDYRRHLYSYLDESTETICLAHEVDYHPGVNF